jgi:spermidine/putrescine transport system ATP-binding protein
MSGGQQQRIAIARALVNEPSVLLLDEPLGALDLKLRKEMQHELKKIQQEVGITFIYVTHDQEEALTMSDKIVVMNEGEIQQIGSPTDIYNEPVNTFVANFIGESDILPGTMLRPYRVKFDGVEFDCVDAGFESPEVDVVVRPEDIYLTEPEKGMIRATIESVTFMGVHNVILARSENGYLWRIKDTGSWEEGKQVGLIINPDGIHIMRKAVSEDEMPLEEVEAIEEEGMEDET